MISNHINNNNNNDNNNNNSNNLREVLMQKYKTFIVVNSMTYFNPLSPELIPICYLLALLGAYHFLHVSRIRVKQT